MGPPCSYPREKEAFSLIIFRKKIIKCVILVDSGRARNRSFYFPAIQGENQETRQLVNPVLVPVASSWPWATLGMAGVLLACGRPPQALSRAAHKHLPRPWANGAAPLRSQQGLEMRFPFHFYIWQVRKVRFKSGLWVKAISLFWFPISLFLTFSMVLLMWIFLSTQSSNWLFLNK